jgi:hypothetical protein
MKTTKAHYVYKITNNKPTDSRKYYIGVRTAPNGNPQEDTKYWSSSKYLKEAINEIGLENFSKEILSTWETREEANAEEIRLHRELEIGSNHLFYNKSNATRDGFYTFNQVTVTDIRDGKTKNVSKEEFNLNPNYHQCTKDTVVVIDTRDNSTKRVTKADYQKYNYFVSPSKGFIIVKDKNNKSLRISLDDYYKNKHLYQTLSTGKVPAIDSRDNSTKMVSIEDYHKFHYYRTSLSGKILVLDKIDNKLKMINTSIVENNKRYEPFNKNKISVIDIRDNTTKRVTKEEYELFDYYVNLKSKRILIFDNKGKLQFETFGNFKKICEKNGLPATAFKTSYNNNGAPLYQNLRNQQISRLKNLNFYKYRGWYAEIVK